LRFESRRERKGDEERGGGSHLSIGVVVRREKKRWGAG